MSAAFQKAVKRISATYGIDSSVLHSYLSVIAHYVHRARSIRSMQPDTDEVNRHIRAIKTAAVELKKQLDAIPLLSVLGKELHCRYGRGGTAFPSSIFSVDAPQSDLHELSGNGLPRLIEILDGLNPRGWKYRNPEYAAREDLIRGLAAMWRAETGRPVTQSDQPGEFVSFMCECADVLGFDSTPLPRKLSRLLPSLKDI